MRDIVHDQEFDRVAAELFGGSAESDDRLLAVEWELARAQDFGRYPLIHTCESGRRVHYTVTEPFLPQDAVVVVFSVAQDGQSVTLHAIDWFEIEDPEC